MTNTSIVLLAIKSAAVLSALAFFCLAITQTLGPLQIQASFELTHQIAGAVISAVGIALSLSHYGGKVQAVLLGRSLLMLLLGLAIFSMSAGFGIAAAAIYIADNIRPALKPERDERNRELN